MAEMTRQNILLLVTPTGAQGAEPAVAWVAEGSTQRKWALHELRVGMSREHLPHHSFIRALQM